MEKESFSQLIASPGLVLVDFYASWCGPCKQMHPVLEELKRQLGDRIRIAKIDVDAHELLAGAYHILSVPTLILFKDGQMQWRTSGALTLAQLKERIGA